MIGIYKITNLLNGKSYIGQSNNLERRKKEHLSGKQYIDLDIQQLGIENFDFEILEYCNKDQLDELEKYWIDYYNTYNDGYNLTKGGQGQFCGGHPILTKEDVIAIRTAYKNHASRKETYLNYKDKISEGGFNHVWDGSRWKHIMPEVYTEENKEYHRTQHRFQKGDKNYTSKLSNEEVIEIRKRYVNETARQIWKDYQNLYTYESFQQILTGVKYSFLPIYKKTQKKWVNINDEFNTDN